MENYGGPQGLSFTLRQLSGRRIKGTFHGDHLKLFVPRSGHLAGLNDLPTHFVQNIRHTRRPKKSRVAGTPTQAPQHPQPS